MEFLSIPFTLFFVITFILYYAKRGKQWQHALLLAASVVFIGYYHLSYLLYAIGITLFTFYAGRLLHQQRQSKQASWIFIGSIVVLAGIWLTARYYSPIFPLGISFYTFQALSYLIEIYWEEEPEESLLDFSLYMMLFMKFLSGPIERAYDMIPQLKKVHAFDYDKIVYGLKLVAWGAFMKLVIADRVAPSLDSVFNDVRDATGAQLLQATMLYPIQLYADFAGYTNMAIGIGMMFGFKLSPNFDRPFVSLSTGELWRRWHQSLSFWVRDYVFMPLSAETRSMGRWGIYLSLLVTFVAIGVWHGAGWTFALYGLFQGIVIIYETAAAKFRDGMRNVLGDRIYKPLMMVRTYILFALSLLFFRVARISDVFYTYQHLFDGIKTNVKEMRLGMCDHDWIVFGIAVVLMLLIEYVNSKHDLIAWSERRVAWQRWPMYVIATMLIFLFGAFGVENFIYIQF